MMSRWPSAPTVRPMDNYTAPASIEETDPLEDLRALAQGILTTLSQFETSDAAA